MFFKKTNISENCLKHFILKKKKKYSLRGLILKKVILNIWCFLPLFSDDEEDILPHSKRKSAVGAKLSTLAIGLENQAQGLRSPTHQLQRIISIEEDHLPQLL